MPVTSLKKRQRGPGPGVFLCILKNFYEHLFTEHLTAASEAKLILDKYASSEWWRRSYLNLKNGTWLFWRRSFRHGVKVGLGSRDPELFSKFKRGSRAHPKI